MRTSSIITTCFLLVILSVPNVMLGKVGSKNQPVQQFHSVIPDENTPLELITGSQENLSLLLSSTQALENSTVKPKSKVIAITLAVTLGVFGVHRLYLGTSTRVPIIYTLTLGGGFGVLVVSDIIAIIATKDLESYYSEPKVFMWAQ